MIKIYDNSRLKFKNNGLPLKVFELKFEQNKDEKEIAKLLNKDIEWVNWMVSNISNKIFHSKKLVIVNKKEENSTSTITRNMEDFIPTKNGYISRRIHGLRDVDILKTAYINKEFVLITGETGTGKTHLVRHFCFENKLPYARVNLNGGTTSEELIGHWVPSTEGGFKWQDGLLTMFVRNGGVLVLDEINACPADILFCLHSLTDDERTLELGSKDGEILRSHPNFFLVATMNPDYEGTKTLNFAFASRFKIKLFFDYDSRIEKKLIKNEMILDFAKKLRYMKEKDEISTPISTRDLLYWEDNINKYNENLAFDIFVNNFEIAEREAIRNVYELISNGKNEEEEKENTN